MNINKSIEKLVNVNLNEIWLYVVAYRDATAGSTQAGMSVRPLTEQV
jgi:hypothetical protein